MRVNATLQRKGVMLCPPLESLGAHLDSICRLCLLSFAAAPHD